LLSLSAVALSCLPLPQIFPKEKPEKRKQTFNAVKGVKPKGNGIKDGPRRLPVFMP